MNDSIASRVRVLIADTLDYYATTPKTRLQDVGITWLEIPGFMVKLEDEFEITLPRHCSAKWSTVGDIIASVEKAVKDAR